MTCTDAAIIGAGPYGPTAAAHLLRAGVDPTSVGSHTLRFRTRRSGAVARVAVPHSRGGVHHGGNAGSARLESHQETAV
jgi:2-polyprenyl-6-methoxyphenol hydroxylase-like FAD-dependent oxidoreductase